MKKTLTSTFACACLFGSALAGFAAAEPVTIYNDTLCTATGTVYFTNCNIQSLPFQLSPWQTQTMWSDANSGCLVTSVTSGISNCDIDGMAAQCTPLYPGGLPSDQWDFVVSGTALLNNCRISQGPAHGLQG